MPLVKLAIKQPIFIAMVLLAIALVGTIFYFNMGVELYPDISNPSVSVSVSFPGASPTDVQGQVTERLERALSTINGVSSLSSFSSEGSSLVTVNFAVGYDVRQGAQDIRQSLDSVQRSLPAGANTPIMRRFDPNSSPFLTAALSVSSNLSVEETRRLIQEIIEPRLGRIPGIAAASVSGYPTQEIRVDLSASRLKAFHVTAAQVVSALRAQNVVLPSGTLSDSSQELPLRTSAAFQNLDEISRVTVAQYGTRVVQVNDVAAVGTKILKPGTLVRVNGQNAMMVQFQMQSGESVVKAANLAKKELASLSHDYPELTFTVMQDNSRFIKESNRDVMLALIIGAVLAAVIVFLFMRDVRNTLITVAGLPIIILGTFAVIALMGFTLNIITLMALSLSVGLLIDDAIVVRENIFRHMENGASPREAADRGTGEIAFAVIAISLTIVAIFIPVAFTSGQIGRLFKQFGITVSVAIMISLFEAFTFAPLLTAYFARPLKPASERASAKSVRPPFLKRFPVWQTTTNWYRRALSWSLHHRLVIVGISVVLFFASVWVLRSMPLTFFPATDERQISINISLPPGSTQERTDQVARQVEQTLSALPEVQRTNARIGSGNGFISVQLDRGAKTDDVIARLRKALAQTGGQLSYSKPNQFLGIGFGIGGIGGRPVQITVQGPVSRDVLDRAAQQILDRISSIPGIRDATLGTQQQQPELNIVVDRERSANAGISASTVGSTVAAMVQGSVATQMQWQGRLTDVRVQLRDEDISDATALMGLPIATSSGNLLPLSALASIQPGTGPARLSRQNQQAVTTVGANLEGRSQGDVAGDIQKALKTLQLPAGITWRFSGQMAQAQSAYSSLLFALALGLVFVYMVLASQFGSFIHPITVMVALPTAVVGSVAAMVIAHVQLSVIAMIGMILMFGLATKNSILLVDFIIRNRKRGLDRTEAVLEAGPVRLRPILMTSLAIIFGMVPTAMALGSAGSFRAPMAITVIGGTISSTLLSLVAVPVFYTVIDDTVVVLSRLFHHRSTMPVTAESAVPPKMAAKRNKDGKTVPASVNNHRRWRRWFIPDKNGASLSVNNRGNMKAKP